MNKETIVCQSREIDATNLNGETVMMNLDKGEYFGLNTIGSRIWNIVSEEITIKDIVNILLNEYEIDNDTCEKSVIDFLKELQTAELIKCYE